MAGSSRWSRLLRFNLAALMFVTLCVCGYLGSHSYGERAGAKQHYDESFFMKTYSLADLLIDTPQGAERDKRAAAIAEELKATVAPASWTVPAKQHGEIHVFSANGSLVITQHGAVHDELAAAIENLRRDANGEHVDAAVKDIESLDAANSESLCLQASHLRSPSV